jgi:hypothetical protein
VSEAPAPLGHVIFAGRRFPVTSVRLAGGAIQITWEIHGPDEGGTAPVTFFGEDGLGIAQVDETTLPEVPGPDRIVLRNAWVVAGMSEE